MEYRRENGKILIRLDRGEELVSSLTDICAREGVPSAVFSGIGALSKAVLATYIDEKNSFLDHTRSGMLEIVSLNGNITRENGEYLVHAHTMLSYLENGEIKLFGGHVQTATVLYTAEIVLEPTSEIGRTYDDKKGISVWRLS